MSCFLASWFPQLFLVWFQEVHNQLCAQKAEFQYIMESLKMKYSDTLVPSEIEGQLQEVTQSLQHIEEKVQGNKWLIQHQIFHQLVLRKQFFKHHFWL